MYFVFGSHCSSEPGTSRKENIRPSGSIPLIYRRRNLSQRQVKSVQRLGMPQEKVTALHKMATEFMHQPRLGRLVEIDNDVTAEDHVKTFPQAEIFVHEIEPSKAQHPSQVRVDAHQPGTAVTAAQQVFAAQGFWDGVNAFFGVNRFARLPIP